MDQALDIALPLCLAVLVLGLMWGLPTQPISTRLSWLASQVNLKTGQLTSTSNVIPGSGLVVGLIGNGARNGLGESQCREGSSYSGYRRHTSNA